MTAHRTQHSSRTSGHRRFAPRAAVAAVAALAVVGVASGTAFAGGKTATASDIWFAAVDGAKVTSTPVVSIGDRVDFGTTVGSLAGYEYPMIDVTCFQDVNGDGVISTVISGPDIVYSQLLKPGNTFTIGGYSSIWTLRGGGPAMCQANLDAYGWKSGKESIRILKHLAFDAQG